MKKLMTLIISLSTFLLSVFTVNADTEGVTSRYEICGDFAYELLADKTASIEKYDGTDSNVSVPAELDGYKVTSLGQFAFYGCETLTSVTISENIAIISESAFNNCENLSEIKIDSKNKVYDSRENCNAIVESKTNNLIAGCKDTVIPDDVKTIADGAFTGCTNLTSIEIPNGVTSIGGVAFSGCENLSSITISESVENIGESIFMECFNLSEIKIDSNNKTYDSRENCNAIIESKTNTLITGCKDTVIPDGVTRIAEEAFWNCVTLTEITIPKSVKSIGDSAFSSCENLTSITIPDSVESIGKYVFHYCINLSEITVDSNNKTYDSRENCNAIIESKTNTLIAGCKDTVIPDDVTSIGEGAFSGCTKLMSITIPKSVKSIGESAFYTTDDSITLVVNKNSYAHKYAKSNDISYELADTDEADIEESGVNIKVIAIFAIPVVIALLIIVCVLIFKKKKK